LAYITIYRGGVIVPPPSGKGPICAYISLTLVVLWGAGMSSSEPLLDKSGKKLVSFLLDEELYKRLKAYSTDSGQTMTQVVQNAISHFLGVRVSSDNVGIQELARVKKLDLPDPNWTEEELARWIVTHARYEVYNAIRVLIREGGGFREFGIKFFNMLKTYSPEKYYFVLCAAQNNSPDILPYLGVVKDGQE